MPDPTLPGPAQLYEDFYGPAIFRPLAQRLMELAPPPPGGRVLDVACGTGIVARLAAERVGPGGRVTAVDINPAMLEMARQLPVPGGTPVEWIEAAAAADGLPADTFDAAYCQQGLQFFPDRAAALGRIRAALKPGARAAIATWRTIDHHPFMGAFAEVEAGYLAEVGVSYDDLVAPFSLGEPAALEAVLEDTGFADVAIADHVVRVRFPGPATVARNLETAYGAVIPEFVADPAAFAEYVAAIERDTRPIVERYTVGDHVEFDMPALLAVARR